MVTTPGLDTRAHKCFHQAVVVPAKKKKNASLVREHGTQNQLRGHNPLSRFGVRSNQHFLTTGMTGTTGTCSRFGKFSPNRIFRRFCFIGRFFGAQKGARLARSGRRRLIAAADASMIFSGGKTCRRLRALLPDMKDDRSSLSAGASSREWCVRQTTKKIRDVFVDETRPERRERDAPAPSARVESPAPNPAQRPRLVSEGPSGENRRSPARCAARSPRLRVPPSRAFCLLPRAPARRPAGPTASA